MKFIMSVIAVLLLFTFVQAYSATHTEAALIYVRTDSGIQIARPEQNWLNKSSIKFPNDLSIELVRVTWNDYPTETSPQFRGDRDRVCGWTYMYDRTIHIRDEPKKCGSGDEFKRGVYHEIMHVVAGTSRYTPWFAHLKAAYERLYPRIKGRPWFTPDEADLPMDERPGEWIANDFANCAMSPPWWYAEMFGPNDHTARVCRMLRIHFKLYDKEIAMP